MAVEDKPKDIRKDARKGVKEIPEAHKVHNRAVINTANILSSANNRIPISEKHRIILVGL